MMAVSENAGDILYTKIFEDYKQYIGFSAAQTRRARGRLRKSSGTSRTIFSPVANSGASRSYVVADSAG